MPSKGVALITGAGQGIGRAIALRLASDGFDIGLSDLASNEAKLQAVAEEIRSQYPEKRVATQTGNVTVEQDVENVIEQLATELGGLDVVVANAGKIHSAPLIDTRVEDWDTIFAINARGVFLTYKHAARKMIELNATHKRGRRIIGASSLLGKMGEETMCAYSGSKLVSFLQPFYTCRCALLTLCKKFAIRGLTQCAATELGVHGITVNAYAPGPTQTALLADLNKQTMERLGSTDQRVYDDDVLKKMSLKYLGKAEDIAALVSFLASEESHFITGQSITIDGGRHFD
ncbi:NAD(P)-binding protein [Coniophora puteana RWD-64-598 SS2]|uniref:NAD(P)-binding protein n=1 Tax=Coniophora puteana (strain RWD-64-598) TaxID=741705 RepID=A0A5M3M9K6_CONPW|nr:NAD(P)-binding protein [Coniophora puteana RWD-64-598 SS2]EIW75480.1 NAD(P)-binding protein [Coniophora puteana RWD-64-598 SS2]